MPTKTEAIKNFLNHKTRPELAELYRYAMEVQVNVAKGKGERFEGSYRGKQFTAWSDGSQVWKSFRVPWKANSTPEYNDSEIKFDLAVHAEAIGLTGWSWQDKKSKWVAFDFDAIVGHSDKHAAKLTDLELEDVVKAAYEIPWVTVRRSTSGNGFHLYVFVDVDTANHNEHAALARAILAQMSAITGFDFNGRVDNCFSGDTEFITDKGVFTLQELAGQKVKILQLTPGGEKWVNAEIKSFGIQKTYPIFFGNNSVVRATSDHQWLCINNNKIDLFNKKYTTELNNNMRLPLIQQTLPEIDWEGFAHGYVFGDGWIVDYHGEQQTEVVLYEGIQTLVDKIAPFGRSVGYRTYEGFQYPRVAGLPWYWKELPENPTKEYAFGFILGLHAADGMTGHKGGLIICQSDLFALTEVWKLAVWVGLRARKPKLYNSETGYPNAKDQYRLHINTYNIDPEIIVRWDHRKKFVKTKSKSTSVAWIGEPKEEEVFCAVTEGYNNFTLANGIVTSNCGGVMWIWHNKFDKSDGKGLELIKEGKVLTEIPINWKDHIPVISGRRKKNKPHFLPENDLEWFDQICGQNQKTPLDDEHKRLIDFLNESDALWWFDSDHHMLVCHTYDLKKAHEKLGMRGIFETMAKGRGVGTDQNAYAFPQPNGVWAVRRHTPGVNEASTWDQDQSGWTRCFLNRDPDLKTIARSKGAVEDENGSFQFQEAEIAASAAETFQAYVDIPVFLRTRTASLKPHKDGRLIFQIDTDPKLDPAKIEGWIKKRGKWSKILDTKIQTKYENEITSHDQLIRHMVSPTGKDAGWVIRADNEWKEEPLAHVKLSLKSSGQSSSEADIVMGTAILRRWKLINMPFSSEYPGDRQWNKNAAQLAFVPSIDFENLNYGTWMKVLDHCGEGLTSAILKHPWCRDNGVITGGEYLKLWVASVLQHPFEPLPYLFFYGLQGSGKSIFHESIDLLMTRGVARADHALKSQSGFNGELQSAVLCVVEETDLRHDRSTAYDRIKDWTTGKVISIHIKGITPYSTPNSTHWCQMSNDIESCPIFPGDTRITMLHVNPLTDEEYIAKRDLEKILKSEAADFLAALMRMELPYCRDRLNIPIIKTEDKVRAEKANQSELDSFIEDQCFEVPGSLILWGEFHDRFKEWLDPERRHLWTKTKVGRRLPIKFPKGRNMRDSAKFYLGNISWSQKQPDLPYTLENDKLVQIESKGDSSVTI